MRPQKGVTLSGPHTPFPTLPAGVPDSMSALGLGSIKLNVNGLLVIFG